MKRKTLKCIACFMAIALLILSISGCTQKPKNNDSDITDNGSDVSRDSVTENKPIHLSEVPEGYIGIYTVEDLKNSTYNTEGNYILMNDIDLSSIADWEGISNNSTFDGNNYTISNLKSTQCGLFFKSKFIKNINVENINISLDTWNNDYPNSLGGLACEAKTVENCIITGKMNVTIDYEKLYNIGGMVGRCYDDNGEIKDCKSGVEIVYTGPQHMLRRIGGICGCTEIGLNKTFENCEFFGAINADDAQQIGGILGHNYLQQVKMENCSNRGKISSNYSIAPTDGYCAGVGGIIGSSSYKITINNCYNIGDISSKINTNEVGRGFYFGGIIGGCDTSQLLSISNCYNIGEINVEGSDKKVGAITGIDRSDNLHISNCAYLKNDLCGITSTNAMFTNCKSMTENEMQDIKNYPFNNITEWENVKNSYPIYKATDKTP